MTPRAIEVPRIDRQEAREEGGEEVERRLKTLAEGLKSGRQSTRMGSLASPLAK